MSSTREARSGSPATLRERLARAERQCAALSARRDELELVVAAARLGYCRIDAARRDGATRAMHANSQFKAEFGWAPDAQPGWQDLEARVVTEDRARLADALHAAISAGADLDLVVQAVWPSGEPQWVALRGRKADQGDGAITVILTSRNVSLERQVKSLEASERAAVIDHERKLRADAEAANRVKDQFLSVFSHELRSPLNAILGWNRILALKRRDDPEVAAISPRIEHSARAQLKMVNDLLDLGRIETGKLRIEPRPMQLSQVAAAALDLARPAAAAKGLTLSADFEPGAGQLRGDPDRLQQVVSNLLSNAVKFTPAGGHISVSLRNAGGMTELCVQDTGQGIPADLLPHVFDRFRQGDASSTRHAGGLGLGLALVREIVSLHGGSVHAVSAGRGAGATFVARFPARQPWKSVPATQSSAAAGLPDQTTLGGLSILVVDDEPDARTVVAETLRLEGARVTVTDSAMSALAKVQEAGAHFDIIVTDIGMPDEDGYSLVRRLRSLQTGRQMLAIAVTGYASRGDVEAAMDAGFDLHVPKPVDFNTFVPMVRRLAHGGR
ncbi:MAG TPA: ATP-binding protein [Steroidobacteraceae bacterium]|nr:ATP-binding protein [Steroidobacteraceae bacterium]